MHWHVMLSPCVNVGHCQRAEPVQAHVARRLGPVVDPKDNWVVCCGSSGGWGAPGYFFDGTAKGEVIVNFADGACAVGCGGNRKGKLGKG